MTAARRLASLRRGAGLSGPRRRLVFVFALGLALAPTQASLNGSPHADQAQAADAWIPFEGTWSATGTRRAVAVGPTTAAATIELTGPVVLSKGDGISRGFTGTAIGFDDGEGTSVGRAVWTDERGDRIFSRLRGEPIGTGRRSTGTITGGTGRYAGATGEFTFSWQYVIEPESGAIQGRTVGLSGRIRRAGDRP